MPMRLPNFDFSRLHPRNLFRRNRSAEQPAPAAGSCSMIPDRGGARPSGEASLRIPEDRLPPAQPEAAGASHVRFPEDANADRAPHGRTRSLDQGNSGATSRSASPPPGYPSDASETNSLTGSPPNPFRSDSPAPSYHDGRLRHDEFRLGEDGIPYAQVMEGRSDATRTPSLLELDSHRRPDTPMPGGSPAIRPESMNSEQLDAYLDTLPPLSRFPTPPEA